MAEYVFDLFAPDVDPDLETPIVRLEVGNQLVNAEFQAVLTGYGKGKLEIHGDHPDAIAVTKRVLVQMIRTDDGPERKIGCFWLEEGDFDVLSRKEQAGRILRFEGPGGLYILDRHILTEDIYAPTQTRRGEYDTPGKWSWNDVALGAILVRLIEEGQNHPQEPYAAIDIDFSRTQDSNGDLWSDADYGVLDYQTDIGTSGSKVLADFLKLGLVVQSDAELNISAYPDVTAFGTDRTSGTFASGKVRFQAGANALETTPKKIHGTQRRSFVLVRGKSGNYIEVDEDVNLNPPPSEPYGGFLKNDSTSNVAALTRQGRVWLTQRERQSDQAKVKHLIGPGGTSGVDGYDPGPDGDYWVGDTVTLHTGFGEHDFNEQELEVAAIRFFLQGGNWIAEAELGAQYLSPTENNVTQVINNSIIRDVGIPLRLCEADIFNESEIVCVAEQVYSAGGGATISGTLPAGFDDGEHIAIAHGLYDGGLSGAGDGIPDGASGWTAIGSGGFSGGASSGIGQHGFWKLLTPGTTQLGTWSSPITAVKLMIFRGMDTADPIGTIASGTQPSGQMSWNTLTPEITDGSSRFLMIGVHESEDIHDNAVTGTEPVTALVSSHGGLGAYWLSDPAAAWAAHTINCTNDDRLETTYELRAAEGSSILRSGMAELVGTSTSVKRCDDTEHYHATGSDSPTVTDDSAHGFRAHTLWINDDGEAWFAADVSVGAADWIPISAAPAGGAPDDAGYLVTAAHADLTSEVVVGATPGGELGGTWASPTVDSTHAGSTHDAATNTHIADASDAHDASAISVLDTGGNFTGTDVEAVLAELDAAIAAGGIPATIVDAKGDLIVATAADTVARRAVGSNGQVLTADSAEADGVKWATPTGGSHSTAQAFVTASTTISASTYADITGASISLAAGTWLIVARIAGQAVNTAFLMVCAITDGSNNLVAEGAQNVPASGTASVSSWGSVTLTAIVTPGSTTTYKLRAAKGTSAPTANWTADDDAPENQTNNGTGKNSDKGTVILAIQLA